MGAHRLLGTVLLAVLPALGALVGCGAADPCLALACPGTSPPSRSSPGSAAAAHALDGLRVAGRGPRTGYARAAFGPAWSDVDHNGCDTRDDVLRRDLTGVTVRDGTYGCVVLSGELDDPYTGQRKPFRKEDAAAVQIDHVVALSDAWQKGAAGWSPARRLQFANDPLELLAVDGPVNRAKGDGDAATWLPPARAYRCRYVARQIAVKQRYGLSVTPAERDAVRRVLDSCPGEPLPGPSAAPVTDTSTRAGRGSARPA